MKLPKLSVLAAALFAVGLASGAKPSSHHTFAASRVMKSAGLVAASAAVAAVVDLGSGFVDADLVIDVTALEVASGDEKYEICIEASNTADMSAGSVMLASIEMGNLTAPMDAATATGRFVLPFRNEQAGTVYRYVRLYTRVAGTIATGINYSAFIAKK